MSASAESSTPERANEQFFELSSDAEGPRFFWARTCDDPECDCRSALIVAHENSDYLKQQVKDRSASWFRGRDATEVFGDLAACELELDWFLAFVPLQEGWPKESPDPRIRRLLAQMSDGLRDEVAALWLHGKGLQLESTEPSLDRLDDWKPGVKVQWSEVFTELRADSYDYEGLRYIAHDHYCVNPDCGCGEVTIVFESFHVSGAIFEGDLIVDTNGRIKVDAPASNQQKVRDLWQLYLARHGDSQAYLNPRRQRMREIGARLFAQHAERVRPRWRSTSRKGRKRR